MRGTTVVIYILIAARILYAKKWKKSEISKQEELIGKIWEAAEMDILSEVLKDCPIQNATERWDLLYKWLESVDRA